MVHSAIVATTIDLVSVPGNGETGICQAKEERDAAIQNVSTLVRTIVDKSPNLAVSINCGVGLWYRVAHLNMSNIPQQCLSAWREYSNITVTLMESGDACGRLQVHWWMCICHAPSFIYSTV